MDSTKKMPRYNAITGIVYAIGNDFKLNLLTTYFASFCICAGKTSSEQTARCLFIQKFGQQKKAVCVYVGDRRIATCHSSKAFKLCIKATLSVKKSLKYLTIHIEPLSA